MKHYYQSIAGWFDFQNVYADAVKEAKDGFHFVEIGSWKGKSSVYMGVEIINSGKKIRFDCIDIWEQDKASIKYHFDPHAAFEEFKKNIEPVKSVLNYYKESSEEASKRYAIHSLDFVFIDASHYYEDVMNDIALWHPLVKVGGMLGGHDYQHGSVQRAVRDFGLTPKIIKDSWLIVKESD